MAIYNEILSARFARGIQKLFSMKGEVPVKQLAGEIMPVFLTGDFSTVENRAILGWRFFGRGATVGAGGAGTFAAYRLRNPTGSNVIAVVEKVAVMSVASQFTLNRGPLPASDLGTIDSANVSVRDVRLGNTSGTLVASSGVPAAVTGFAWLQMQTADAGIRDGILYENQECVIGPGDQATLWNLTANSSLVFSLMWRERQLEESELAT